MTDEIPDRLSIEERSPYYNGALLARGVGVIFKGVERNNVAEYCISERWVRLIPGYAKGAPIPMDGGRVKSVKLQGDVEVFLKS